MAVLLDKEIRGTRIYQSALYLPVVLSLAIIGFIWQLQYSTRAGLHQQHPRVVAGTNHFIDWLGDPSINLWAVLVAASWRHVGLHDGAYLAGLKSVDPSLREAAAMDGANQRQTFFRVVFPVMRPINIVILVITVIEALRAFDLVYIINRGLNGLELLSVLVTNNIIGEASRVGFGSAIAVVLLVISRRADHRAICHALTARGSRNDRRCGTISATVERAVAYRRRRIRWGGPCCTSFLIAISLLWLFPLAYAVYTSLRPYATRRTAATRRCPGCLNLDNYVNGLEPGRDAALLPQHADHRRARRVTGALPRVDGRRSRCRGSAGASTCLLMFFTAAQPAAAAGRHHAALPPVPGAAVAGVAERQRPVLRPVFRDHGRSTSPSSWASARSC